MKVGIDVHTLGSKASGNENYCLQLLQDVAKTKANDNRYVIYYTHLKGRAKIPLSHQFEVKRIRPANPWVRIPISFPIAFRREKLDVFHTQYFIPPFCNCRAVTTIHDILYESHPELFSATEIFRFRTLIPWSARRADHIITVSAFSKRDIVKRYNIDPEKITVVDEAPREVFRAMNVDQCRDLILRKYKLAEPFVLYVGRVNVRKNLLRLVEAFSLLKKKGIPHKLIIVGNQDWQAERVKERVRELSMENSVVFTGYVDWDDVPVFYNAAELFAFPSICEGFGAPVLEAMACGVPVVTSYGSSLEEVAGDAAVLADPSSVESIAAAMERVLGDLELRRSLRDKGLKRVNDFSGTRKAAQTISIYQKVYGRN